MILKVFFISYKDYRTYVIDEIWLNEDLSMTLITGYDPKRRLALIEQWQDANANYLNRASLLSPYSRRSELTLILHSPDPHGRRSHRCRGNEKHPGNWHSGRRTYQARGLHPVDRHSCRSCRSCRQTAQEETEPEYVPVPQSFLGWII
jgi:hypothetical protein